MNDIQVTISNLIASQFPEVYRDEGSTLVSFVEAYFEWLEQNFQLLTLESNTGFVVGSLLRQGDVTGTIVSFLNNDLLVKVDGIETFKCFNICANLDPITTVTDSIEHSTALLAGGSRRLGTIFHARNLQNYRDIDSTIDLFINQFKEKYLSNIDFDALSNKQLLIKNSLSLYRSKGTERSVDLFFRLVYGTNAEVIRPSDFLFQPSGAEWSRSTYLEISPDTVTRAIELVGKEITGVTSGANAFVEKYIKLKTLNGFSNILFISNIKGQFIIRELLRDDQVFLDSPTVYGSLSEVDITLGVSEFKIGDIVDLNSLTGINGLGRVVEVRFASGEVEFELQDGGYGYSLNFDDSSDTTSRTLVADHLVTLTDVNFGNVASSIVISTPGTGYSNTDLIYFNSNFGRDAVGEITTNGSGGITQVSLLDKGSGFIYTIPNDISFTVNGPGSGANILCLTDYPTEYITLLEPVTQPGNPDNPEGVVISLPKAITLNLTTIQGPIVEGEVLYQVDPTLGVVAAGTVARTNLVLNQGLVVLNNIQGVFRKNFQILNGRGTTGLVNRIESLSFAISLTTPERFTTDPSYQITTVQTGLNGLTSSVSTGENASFSITSIRNTEEIVVNTNLLSNPAYLNTPLNATVFNLPADPSANVSSFILDSLSFDVITIGKINAIGGFSPGSTYSTSPEVLVFQPFVNSFDKNDLIFEISGLTGSFLVNELIEQTFLILTRIIDVSDSTGFSVGEPVIITDALNTLISNGTVSSVTDSTTLEIKDVTSVVDFNGLTLRSLLNSDIAFTISGNVSIDREVTARGIVKSFTPQSLSIQRLSFNDVYAVGVSFVGTTSGVSANVLSIQEDETTNPLGFNASVVSSTISSDGTIAGLQVIDSGFGFIDNQEGSFVSPNGNQGQFRVVNGGVGTGSGSYRSIKGFTSDQSKLFDGDYYQEYSYDILSKIPISKYGQMFREVMHTAGTKFFGSVLIDSFVDVSNKTDSEISDRMTIGSSDIIVSNTSPFDINSVNITASPAPAGATSISDPNLRSNLAPVVDFANINIQTRD